MNYTYEKHEKSCVKFTITFDKTDFDNAIMAAYQKNKNKFNVPGFRKGHVPFHVIVSQYGKEYFYEDAINYAIGQNYPEILQKEEENVKAVGDPDFSLENIDENGFVITAIVPVMPEFELGAYKGIKIEKVEYNVTDEDIEKDIERLLDRNAKEVNVTDRACQKGDIVVIDYSGSVDGVKFDGGTAEKQRLELGSGAFIPGFEEQVEGMNIGDERNINVRFPDDYTEPLNGKDAVFAIKLHEIIVKEKPELTDEFIKEATGDETIEAHKAHVRHHMEEDNERRATNENEDKLLSAIADGTSMIIPDSMIDDEVAKMIQQFSYRLMYQGLKYEDYLKVTNQTEEDVKKSYRPQAEERVKKQLIVNKIIETESIKAEPEEVEAKVAEQAKSVDKEVEEYKKTMDPRQFEYISNEIVIDKLFKFLTDNNEFVSNGEKPKKATKKSSEEPKKTTAKKSTKKKSDQTDGE
ncbi:MAG: trigger factor [Clostridia bacterium]|nr:trigger factor [Clostridia bacterium]